MRVYRDLTTTENQKFWETVDAAQKVVSGWPPWKLGVALDRSSEKIRERESERERAETSSRKAR